MKRPFSSPGKTDLRLETPPVLVSACLLGVRCRYDGGHSLCPDLLSNLAAAHIVPFCPEQLGGLPTPRPPANIIHGDGTDVLDGTGKVIDGAGRDFSDAFKKGARESLRIARLLGCSVAVVKDRSPSCGVMTTPCDKKNGSGPGVTAALFLREGMHLLEQGKDSAFPMDRFLGLVRDVHSRKPR